MSNVANTVCTTLVQLLCIVLLIRICYLRQKKKKKHKLGVNKLVVYFRVASSVVSLLCL